MKLQTVLVANRGEIACRLLKTCKRMGLKTVAVYSDVDAKAPHALMADVSMCLGNPKSYLDPDAIIQACQETGAQAVLPGYGFLSESPGFVEALTDRGIVFVGPTAESMSRLAWKHQARRLARDLGIPLAPGSQHLIGTVNEAVEYASIIGYPVMVKSTAGGGGIGMSKCDDEDQLRNTFYKTASLARSSFGHGGVYMEKYIANARHIEIQVFGDKKGNVVCLGERECSGQRRHQKVIEETPSPYVTMSLREAMCESARLLCKQVGYQSAGTVEFLVDSDTGDFYFLEVNTRLQVEHTVTEMVSGLDLVEWMLRLAGDDSDFSIESYIHTPKGHSIECRVYAENPAKDFRPCTGVVTSMELLEEPWVRYDGWVSPGTLVTPHYDSLLMKVIVYGNSRPQAIQRMVHALDRTTLGGIQTNLDYLHKLCKSKLFSRGELLTDSCNGFDYQCPSVEVVKPGMYSTLQNWPGRKGYWSIGVPPSGPMDHLSLRMANRLVGNTESACGIEMTIVGMTLRFHRKCTVAVTGATAALTYNGRDVPQYFPLQVESGGVLKVGRTTCGIRTYLAVAGGFDVPDYLGSKSTFVLGKFGGLQGGTLKTGDMLPLSSDCIFEVPFPQIPKDLLPNWTSEWTIGVMYGPHGAPDFFTQEYMSIFWSSTWKVHHNSNRLGVRLIGPKPTWTRNDGGEAGLHPSNIHDCEYAIGSVNFTGDHPVILGVDGPSLGGFVCPVTIVSAELWKLGQLAPGDSVQFVRISFERALQLKHEQQSALESVVMGHGYPSLFEQTVDSTAGQFIRGAILLHSSVGKCKVLVRAQGDESMLIEYGPMKLDLELRFLVRMFMEWINSFKKNNPGCGIGEISPGVRSVQLQYSGHIDQVLNIIQQCVYQTRDEDIPCRIIHLPLAFDDRWNAEAVQRYMDTVASDTPYVPSNIDFVTRINGLNCRQDVQDIMLEATYLVLGLGDVYLNAPCAVPIDPRHRLVTSKYSPARTFTPEGSVGIGGSYLCIYGMESPGGYQLVGRTLPIWSSWKTPPFLFRFFDQIKFYLVDDEELLLQRNAYTSGKLSIRVEETIFRPSSYRQMLRDNADSIEEFCQRQQQAFEEERQRWVDSGMISQNGHDNLQKEEFHHHDKILHHLENAFEVTIAGNIWKIPVHEGQQIEQGEVVAVLESMKMELTLKSDRSGIVKSIMKRPGQFIGAGECIMIIEKSMDQ